MRKAAGIILIIVGVSVLVGMIIDVIGMSGPAIPSSAGWNWLWDNVSYGVVWGGLLIAGGVLCLKKRYWGLCLISALLPLVLMIIPIVGGLQYEGYIMTWINWVMLIGPLVATILISVTKKEWEEVSG